MDLPPPAIIEVVTYNIRYDAEVDIPNGNGWQDRRRAQLTDWLIQNPADVFGFQEVLPTQNVELRAALPGYEYYGVPRDNGKALGEMSPVFWKADRFEKILARTLWLSPTPDVPSKGWDAGLPCIATHVSLCEIATGKRLEIWNTHFDNRGDESRLESAKLIAREAASQPDSGAIKILMGDFNCLPDWPPIIALKEAGWTIVDAESGAEILGAPGTVEARFVYEKNPHRIDHILFRGPLRPLRRITQHDERDGRLASDHLPVRVVFEFK
jgi:endonuclease/exonuclease/phosphatase family metal-dependent hydrolase